MDYGSFLREKREKAGLTQEQLSKKIGVSQPCLSRYERNSLPIPLNIVPDLAKALRFDAAEMMK